MRRNKLAVLSLTLLIATGGLPTFASAATIPDAAKGNPDQRSNVAEDYKVNDQEDVQNNANYVKSLTGITDEEKAILLESYNAMGKINEQIDTVYGDKVELNATREKEVEGLYSQLDALYEKTADIEAKVYSYETEEYVKSLANITNNEKTLLIETYNAKYNINEQIDAINRNKVELNASEEKELEGLYNQVGEFSAKITDIEAKTHSYEAYVEVSNADYVKSLTGITNEEKAILLETITAFGKVYQQIDAIYKDKAVLNTSEEKEVEGLYNQLNVLYEKIADIEAKVN